MKKLYMKNHHLNMLYTYKTIAILLLLLLIGGCMGRKTNTESITAASEEAQKTESSLKKNGEQSDLAPELIKLNKTIDDFFIGILRPFNEKLEKKDFSSYDKEFPLLIKRCTAFARSTKEQMDEIENESQLDTETLEYKKSRQKVTIILSAAMVILEAHDQWEKEKNSDGHLAEHYKLEKEIKFNTFIFLMKKLSDLSESNNSEDDNREKNNGLQKP